MAALVVRRPGSGTVVYPLAGHRASIGRSATAEVRLLSPLVSRVHAQLSADAAGFTIEDCGSKNGTFVGGRRLQGRERLLHGEEVVIGDLVLSLWEDGPDSDTVTQDPKYTGVALDPVTRELLPAGSDGPIRLSAQEMELLTLLMESPGQTCTHATIGARIWGVHDVSGQRLPAYSKNMIHRLVHRLRRKLGAAPAWTITSVGTVGYALTPRLAAVAGPDREA